MAVMRELRAAEAEAESIEVRFMHEEVMRDIRARLKAVSDGHV